MEKKEKNFRVESGISIHVLVFDETYLSALNILLIVIVAFELNEIFSL